MEMIAEKELIINKNKLGAGILKIKYSRELLLQVLSFPLCLCC
jgi:hypothetical protein